MNLQRSLSIPPEVESLEPFVVAGVFEEVDFHVAAAIARRMGEIGPEVILAVALCVRALRMRHACVVLSDATTLVLPEGDAGADAPLPWPDVTRWAEALKESPVVVVRDPTTGKVLGDVEPTIVRPLVFDGVRIYLERYWDYERRIGDRLLAQVGHLNEVEPTIGPILDRLFGSAEGQEPDLQREAVMTALGSRVTLLAGGPGTGKTYTVARLLVAVHELAAADDRALEVALAAPTGKAAARMTEALHQAVDDLDVSPDVAERVLSVEASTIHRLLGWSDGVSFRHGADDVLPHDLIVVDETSMVDLPLMAKLLEAVRPDARLVLVGDPFQLASVEAGAVLGDVVGPVVRGDDSLGPMNDGIVVLRRVRRFGAESSIARLADAVRSGDVDAALDVLSDPGVDDVEWIDPDDHDHLDVLREQVAQQAADVVGLALSGDGVAAVEESLRLKVLCATRWMAFGSYAWRDDIERRLRGLVSGVHPDREWYVGRPVIATRNDYVTKVFNGDTGITISRDGTAVVAMPGADGIRELPVVQLGHVETWWAMTVHKSQGSEFEHAVVSLPTGDSSVLTNELLYTAVTRAKEKVTLVATRDAIRTAIGRPIRRASGLGERLRATT